MTEATKTTKRRGRRRPKEDLETKEDLDFSHPIQTLFFAVPPRPCTCGIYYTGYALYPTPYQPVSIGGRYSLFPTVYSDMVCPKN